MSYIISSGITSDGIILTNDSMTVLDGGTVDNTAVSYRGSLIVSKGGFANHTQLYESGAFTVSSGGSANSTIISGAWFNVSFGATANNTTINSNGHLFVFSGGTATGTTINSIGGLYVYSGGTANSTTVNSGGGLFISSGGTANSTTVNSGGWIGVESGGTATNIVWTPCVGSLNIDDGAYVTFASQYSGVYYGSDNKLLSHVTMMTSKEVDDNHQMFVMSDGTANSTLVNSDGRLFISSGGMANNTVLNGDNARLEIFTGGVANNTTVNQGGELRVSEGGLAHSAAVNSDGRLFISSGGTANSTTVNSGGWIGVESGGTATNIVWTPCEGSLSFEDGAVVSFASQYSGVYYGLRGCLLSNAITMEDLTVESNNELYVMSDGTANNTTVNSGYMVVWGGGMANDTTAKIGKIHLYGAGRADNTIIVGSRWSEGYWGTVRTAYGELFIHSGGQAHNATVNNFGQLSISSGGTANSTTVNSGGCLAVSSGGTANSTTVNSSGTLNISSGGTANITTVNPGGELNISSGGTATNIVWTPCVGSLNIDDGAYVTFASQYSGVYYGSDNRLLAHEETMDGQIVINAIMFVMSGGLTNSTSVNGTDSNSSLGYLYILNGGLAEKTTLYKNGKSFVQSNGTANSTMVNSDGYLNVSNGGVAIQTTVNSGGHLDVSSGGAANSTILSGGGLTILSGGIVNNTTMNGGTLRISSGGKMTGRLLCLYGEISAFEGAIVDFNLTSIMPGTDARINNLSRIQGTPNYTITVKARQEEGIYLLADGAGSFNQTITVVNTVGEELGVLSVGETTAIAGMGYTLNLTGQTLSVRIGENITPSPYTSNGLIVSNGTQTVQSGEVFFDTLILSSGGLMITSGGTAATTAVYSNGRMIVSSGGSATNITAHDGAYLGLVVASDTYIAGTSGGAAFEIKDGKVSDYTVNSGYLQVYSGGMASSIIVSSGGWLYLNGGQASNTIISSGGNLHISSGGVVDNVTISADACLTVYSGGTATNVIWTPFVGKIDAEEGAYVTFASEFSGIYYGSGTTLLSSAAVLNSVTIEDSYEMFVMSDGLGNQTSVSSRGKLYVHSGGRVNNTTVNGWGSMFVYGGRVNRTTISEWGSVFVSSGGFASDVTVNSNGSLCVESGGTATGITASSGAYLGFDVASGTYVVGTSDGSAFELKDGKASDCTINTGHLRITEGGMTENATVNQGGTLYVTSHGFASQTTINSRGKLIVSSGGSAVAIVENGGWVDIQDGAEVLFTAHTISGLILSGTSMTVHSGTTAARAAVERGRLVIYSGGVASRVSVNIYGSMYISSGGVASRTSLNGSAYNNTRYYSGCMYVSEGGTADSTKVNAGGFMRVFSGGLASNTSVFAQGLVEVSKGGIAKDTMIRAGGNMNVSEGRITGQLTLEEGAIISIDSKSVLDFDISGRTPGSPALINNHSLILGSPKYTLTVSETQVGGVYTLADEVDVFNSTITVQNKLGEALGTLTVDGTLTLGETTYMLSLDDSLVLAVDAPDRIAPTVSNIQASTTELTNQDVVVTAEFTDDESVASSFYKLGDNGLWQNYPESGVTIYENGTVYFKAVDTSGNESEIVGYTVSNIDKTPPEKPVASANVTTPTNMDVLVTATFSEDSVIQQYSLDGKHWGTYPGGVLVGTNLTVYFRGIDAAGNASEAASYEVTNVDRSAPVITLTGDNQTPANEVLLTAETDDGSALYYCVDDSGWTQYKQAITVTENGTYSFMATDAAGNTAISEILFANIKITAPVNLAGTADRLSWEDPTGGGAYVLELSTDGFGHAISLETEQTQQDLYELPAGTYQWRVKDPEGEGWAVGEEIVSENETSGTKVVQSNADGNNDLFFATPTGTWSRIYYAQHVGSVDDEWTGTGELVSANGKGQIQNLYFGSADPNVLCLTDADNGDAIFVDDVYTDSPNDMAKETSRLYKIQEIRAGAGDDIVDMTSNRFEYTGDGLTIRGGDGDDVIWANKGDNWLFGDAGDDRIVGASGSDVIGGGIGNDRMHGGGGEDIFTFCENWGIDTVEQLETGTVTLWFASGSLDNWDSNTLTYSDGDNSVTVKGVTSVELKFGENSPSDVVQFASLSYMGVFDAFTSQRIFEESGKGILA